MQDNKNDYLQIIQGTINRLSTTSAIFKGFAATVVANLLVSDCSNYPLRTTLISCIVLFIFMGADSYYLQMERNFRHLYDAVRLNQHPVDYSMNPSIDSTTKLAARSRLIGCLASPSICFFYIPLLACLALLALLKN